MQNFFGVFLHFYFGIDIAGIEEIEEFDEELYQKLIKQIVVYKDDSVRVIFPNNNSIRIGYRDL